MAIVNLEDYYFIYGGGGVDPEPTTRWAPRFNGVDTYIDLNQNISLRDGATLSFWVIVHSLPESGSRFTGRYNSNSNNYSLVISSDGSINSARADVYIDDVLSTTFPNDGLPHKIEMVATSYGVLSRLGATASGDSVIDATLWGVIINGADQGDYELPLDEEFSNYPNLTGTGDLNATAYNFTEDDVVEVE